MNALGIFVTISPGSGVSLVRRQAITWTNDDLSDIIKPTHFSILFIELTLNLLRVV